MNKVTTRQLKTAVLWAAVLNGGYFFVEFFAGLAAGSVSLIADSIDFLEDASLNVLILVGFAFAAAARARLGSVLAIIIGVPSLAALVAAIDKVLNPVIPHVQGMSLAAFGALIVNSVAALILMRVRNHEHSLVTAAWLSARNDVLANVAIIAAAGATALVSSTWWDVIVGLVIGYLNADAAVKVWKRSRTDLKLANAAV
jgi:divalent metal cation (Fe/Co/Zn/Cd) transporter